MENYFAMNLTKQEIDTISNLGLAHMGDCVFEILCRGYLCARGGKNVGNLHRDTINMVKASSQAKFVDKLLPMLTEEELAYYRRGKDSRSAFLERTVPSSSAFREFPAGRFKVLCLRFSFCTNVFVPSLNIEQLRRNKHVFIYPANIS